MDFNYQGAQNKLISALNVLGMYTLEDEETLASAISFANGFDLASNSQLLTEFRNYLIKEYFGGKSSFGYPKLIKNLLDEKGDNEKEKIKEFIVILEAYFSWKNKRSFDNYP